MSEPIVISECVNGFIVKVGSTNCAYADSDYRVFESWQSLFKFIEEHFSDLE